MSAPCGIILAGGRASRMGGGDKGRLELGGQTLLGRVMARLSPQVASMALNANGDPQRFTDLGLPVIADSIAGHPGPLGGVLAGLDWAAEEGFDRIVTVAADTPFFPRDLVARLEAATEGMAAPLALAAGTDGRHPTFGLWPVSLRDDLRGALQEGLRKVVQWTDAHDARTARFDSTGSDPFFNVNTPDDLARAKAMLAGGAMRLFGVVGWKNAGKTGLVERLVAEFCARGLSVSTIKHTHHAVDLDRPGTDTFRHRAAGAGEVILASDARVAILQELRGAPEPDLEQLAGRLAPVDVVLVEGFKASRHPKIEVHRAETGGRLIASDDATIRAVAADCPVEIDRPVFDLSDTGAIADFILSELSK